MNRIHTLARIPLILAVVAFLVVTQNSSADDAAQLPATKHQAESLDDVSETKTPASVPEQDGIPLTPHQHDTLDSSRKAITSSDTIELSGAAEVPAVTTSASGSGTITIGADLSVSGRVTTSELAGTAAHIHGGATGVNGPVIITLTKVSDGVWGVPAGATITSAQFASYKSGDLYVNVHSEAHPAGEIRAQLKP